jgi:hypothetical protein
MGLTAAILGALGGIAAVLGVLEILEVTSEPIIHENLSWIFWMYAAIILILGAIAFLLGRRQNYPED